MAAAARRMAAVTRVLAVDDDPHICQLMTEMLSGETVEVECVRTDREAIRRLDDDGYSALIVDINLGAGVTGFDLARHARRVDPGVAVIYISGQASKRSYDAFAVRGAMFVEKPFTETELRKALEKALGKRR